MFVPVINIASSLQSDMHHVKLSFEIYMSMVCDDKSNLVTKFLHTG